MQVLLPHGLGHNHSFSGWAAAGRKSRCSSPCARGKTPKAAARHVPIWEADTAAGFSPGGTGGDEEDEWEDEEEDESEDWVDLEADDTVEAQQGGDARIAKAAGGFSTGGSMLGRCVDFLECYRYMQVL